MFLKKYVKENKTYYLLVQVFQRGKDNKPNFEQCFIPEKLAQMLIKLGVEVKNEKENS